MDFFDQQRKSRQQSYWLLGCFIGVLFGIALLIHVVATLAGLGLGDTLDFSSITPHAKLITGAIWLTIFLGGMFRWMDVRGGGSRLARRFGAESVDEYSRTETDRLLRNVVAEMAVAASLPEPSIWVMRHERSVNAFVLGGSTADGTQDIALVVSQGALDLLDREELQGVVAHEFGHLSQGDLPVNMRLLIVLGGLMAVDEVGRTLTGSDLDRQLHPGVVVGFVLRALGSIGVFAGRLIRAAFSRKREFLADASAIQFTRNTYGLASALDKSRELYDSSGLSSNYAEELAHLCFHVSWGAGFMQRILATHPLAEKRIAAIDPYFSIKQRKKQRSKKESELINRSGITGQSEMSGGSMVCADGDVGYSGISDRFELMITDTTSSVAMLFALFASNDPANRERYYDAVSFAYNRVFADKVRACTTALADELDRAPLAAIELVSPKLAALKPDSRRLLLLNLETLIDAEGESTLRNYAALQLIRRKLKSDFPVLDKIADTEHPRADQRKIKRIDQISTEVSLLLSLVIESSGASGPQLDADYLRVLKCYTADELPRRSANDEGVVAELKQAFQTLYVQPLSQREAFIQHCTEIVESDGRVVSEEKMVLELFAASLEVPVRLAA